MQGVIFPHAFVSSAKGVNAGVKAYKDEVVIVQQWGEGGKSKVKARLNDETASYQFSADYYDFEVNFILCDLVLQPMVTGPLIEIEGTASQSSTVSGAQASRAIDGNLDQTWVGNSVTHTSVSLSTVVWNAEGRTITVNKARRGYLIPVSRLLTLNFDTL